MLTLAKKVIFVGFLLAEVDFFMYLFYTWNCIGGVNVNEFEQNVQSKNNDVVDSIKGFGFSFVFFVLIFAIGVIFNYVGS